jgi:hypothetical protein
MGTRVVGTWLATDIQAVVDASVGADTRAAMRQVVAGVGRNTGGQIGAAAHKGGVSHAPGLRQSASFSSKTGRNFSRHEQSTGTVAHRATTN